MVMANAAARSALIVTALPVETEAVLPFLRHRGTREPDRWGVYYIRGTFPARQEEWQVAVVEVGQGNESAAVKTALAVPHVRPEVIILIGIAGGLKDVRLGDVVIATAVQGYEKGKETEVAFLARPSVYNSDSRLVEAARHVARMPDWRQRITYPGLDPKAILSPIAAGTKVVASETGTVRQFLRERFSDAVAVEMEGLGLLMAAHHVNVPAVVIRGVSDLADRDKSDDWQARAAGNASAFAFELLSQVRLPRLPPAGDEPEPVAVQFAEIPEWEWRPGLFAPSALLRAEFSVVPFLGRTSELNDLLEWSRDDRELSARLYTGAGGMGKTRLMIELCKQLRGEGWYAGFLSRELAVEGLPQVLRASTRDHDRCLIVVDYAETRIPDVTALLRAALAWSKGRACRLVLLARARGDWWTELQRQPDRAGEFLSGPATEVKALRALASAAPDRRSVFDSAVASFSARVDAPKGIHEIPDLEAEYNERALYILIAALAAVEGQPIKGENGLLDYTLERERRLLDDGVIALSLQHLKGDAVLQAAAVATLVGSASSRDEAARLLSAAPLLAGESPNVVRTVAELLHRLYPGQSWLQGVLPDLLGEHLVERVLENDPALLDRLFAPADET
jgi:5'-methylthioadenosine/S-adenosylhomocysteine nucleosidase